MTSKNLIRFPSCAPTETSDVSLLSACARRESQAMGAFFDRHARAIYCFLARLYPQCRADIDDWVHATFLQAMESAAVFRKESTVRTWLLGIALNIGRQHMRKERRRAALLDLVFGHSAASPPQPDQLLENQQNRTRLAHALADLTEDQRMAFVLCDLEELPGKDAAVLLGIPQGTLGRRLFHARQNLREALCEEGS